jgi:hypothetical protein
MVMILVRDNIRDNIYCPTLGNHHYHQAATDEQELVQNFLLLAGSWTKTTVAVALSFVMQGVARNFFPSAATFKIA